MLLTSKHHPIKIWVHRNGDVHSYAKRILVNQHRFRSWEQFLTLLTNEIGLTSGAVRKLYNLSDKLRQTTIATLVDNAGYLAVGNEPLQLNLNYKAPPDRTTMANTQTKSRTHTGTAQGTQPGLFRMDSKGFRIAVFQNGDFISPPARMVLCFRNCHTYEQFLNEVTRVVKLKQGRVKRMYDAASMKEIRSLKDLYDGQNIVASGTSRLVPGGKYQLVDFKANPRSFTQESKLITVYPNGDMLHTGYQLTLTKLRFPTLGKVLAYLSQELTMYTGKPTHLCEFNGTKVTDLEALVNHGNYVLVVGTDKFRPPPTAFSSISRATAVLERSKMLLQSAVDPSTRVQLGPVKELEEPPRQVFDKEPEQSAIDSDIQLFSSSRSPPPPVVDLSIKRADIGNPSQCPESAAASVKSD